MPKQHRTLITDFYELGLMYGDTLTYDADHTIIAKVVSNKKVSYKNNEYSLSGLTIFLETGATAKVAYANTLKRSNVWEHWLFNGRTIADRRIIYRQHCTIEKMRKIKEEKT